MKTLTLPKEHLDFFGSVLQQFGGSHGPVAHGERSAFPRLGNSRRPLRMPSGR